MTEQPYQNVVSADNPELANDIVNQVLSAGAYTPPQAAPAEDEVQRRDIMPPDGVITLPGGYINQQGELITEVEIVEMTGRAEEALARPMGGGKRFNTILEHTVERVGDMEPNHEILNRMLIGDRNMVLMYARHVTYGPVELSGLSCPHCSEKVDISIDLTKDVPVKKMADPLQRRWTVPLAHGSAELVLPDGASQTEIMNAEVNSAELTSMILKGALEAVNGIPAMGIETARNLSARDRRTLMASLNEKDFGPQLDEVAKNCPSCSKEIRLPLYLSSLF